MVASAGGTASELDPRCIEGGTIEPVPASYLYLPLPRLPPLLARRRGLAAGAAVFPEAVREQINSLIVAFRHDRRRTIGPGRRTGFEQAEGDSFREPSLSSMFHPAMSAKGR